VRAAWAVLQGRYTSAAEVVFGAVVTGRQAPVWGVEQMVGPTIATVPVRVVLDEGATVTSRSVCHAFVDSARRRSTAVDSRACCSCSP
jgi:non-ribosomal peptide synthetase component F